MKFRLGPLSCIRYFMQGKTAFRVIPGMSKSGNIWGEKFLPYLDGKTHELRIPKRW